jgi:large repetitive protein
MVKHKRQHSKNVFLLMTTLILILVFMTSAFAAHTHYVTVSPTHVNSETQSTYTINVANTGGDPINRVRIEIPSDNGGYSALTCGVAPADWTIFESSATECIYTTSVALIADENDLSFTLQTTSGSNDAVYTWSVASRDDQSSWTTSYPTTTVDDTNPTYTISYSNSGPVKAGDEITITATFDEPVQNTVVNIALAQDGGDAQVLNSVAMTRDTSTIYTYVWTVGTGDGDLIPEVTGALDLAGNAVTNTGSTRTSIEVDNTLPVLTSIGLNQTSFNIASRVATVTFTFSEEVESFTVEDVTSPNGDISNFGVTGNPLVYTATFTADLEVEDATNEISVGTAWADLAGNAPAEGQTSANYVIDTIAPVITTVSLPTGDYGIGDSITVTITADQVGYSAGAITINGESVTGFTDNEDNTYTVTYTVSEGDTNRAATQTPVSVVLVDDAGNSNAAFTTLTETGGDVTIDAVRPSIDSISIDDETLVFADLPTELVTITFTEDVTIPTVLVNADAQTVNNCGDENDATWCFTYTIPTTESTMTVTVSGAVDDVGNVMTADSSTTFDVDTVRPELVSIGLNQTSFNIASRVATVTFTFSEEVESFTVEDVTSPNGDISNFGVTGNPLVYTATFTADLEVEDATNEISVGTAWADLAGNAPAAGQTSANYVIDTIAPVITTVSLPTGDYGIGDSITVTITADQVGYSAGAITINGESVTGFTDNEDNTYTVTYTVSEGDTNRAATQTPVSVVLVDDAGNSNAAFTTLTETGGDVTIDAVRPSIDSISIDDETLVFADLPTELVTITFTEDVTIPTVLVNADAQTVNNCGDENDATWCFTYTIPTTESTMTVTVSGAVDDVGNVMTADSSTTFDVDTVRPELVSIGLNQTSFNIASRVATVTFTFSEEVESFTVEDVTSPNGDISNFGVTGNPLVYTATFTADLEVEDATNEISVGTAWADLAGNAPAAGQTSANYVIDTIAPANYDVEFTTTYVGTTASFTIFDTSDGGLEAGATYYYNISDGETDVTGSGTVPVDVDEVTVTNVDISNLGDGVVTVTVYLVDEAGNRGSDESDTASRDTEAPTIVFVNGDDMYTASQFTQSVTVEDSESGIDTETYQWSLSWGDDLVFGTPDALTTTIFGPAGQYYVEFTVSDNAGNEATQGMFVTIGQYAFNYPQNGHTFQANYSYNEFYFQEFKNIGTYDEEFTFADMLSSSAGPYEQRLVPEDVVVLYTYIDGEWVTYVRGDEDSGFDANMYDVLEESTSIFDRLHIFFGFENSALGKAIRHAPEYFID